MPLVFPTSVVSFSSEDPNHPASNLLNRDTFRKWKCKDVGEKEAFVILKFDKAVCFTGIDIGNESSAMVEVLVGRSGGDGDVKYETLLSSSVLMSPADSRTLKNPNGVRNYSASAFDKETGAQKWDIVKIVVSQIFNKQTQFGLTFVKFTCPADPNEPAKIGIFSLRKPLGLTNDEDEAEPSRIGAMFAKSMASKSTDSPDPSWNSTSAAIRETTRAISNAAQKSNEDEVKNVIKKSKVELTVEKLDRSQGSRDSSSSQVPSGSSSDKLPNRNTLADAPFVRRKTNQRDSSPSEGSTTVSSVSAKQATSMNPNSIKTTVVNNQDRNGQLGSSRQKTDQSQGTGNNLTGQGVQAASHSPSNPASSTNAGRKKIQKKPFNKLFDGVIFVMSGFENPFRKELRDKAIEMGARCKPNWDSSCTHLICAFVNTPKFRDVRRAGNGKIVKKDWIERSYEARCRIPWRIFHLDPSDRGAESEEEIWAEDVGSDDEIMDQDDNTEEMPTGSLSSNGDGEVGPEKEEVDGSEMKGCEEDENGMEGRRGKKRMLAVEPSSGEESDGDPYNADTDVDEGDPPNNSSMSKKSKNDGGSSGGSETDFEEDQEKPNAIKNNDDDTPVDSGFFENCVFFLSLPKGRASSNQRSRIEQIISKRKGLVEPQLTESVEYYIVSSDSWTDEFSEALSDNPNMSFVHYNWILQCDKENKMVSCHRFILKAE